MTQIRLSDDHLEAHLVLEPEQQLPEDAIRDLLIAAGVRFGLLDQAIAEAAAAVGPATLLVARGTPAREGRDGRVTYAFRAGRQPLRPQIAEDGTADFRNLGLVVNVQPGQVLATREPAQPGTEGRTVLNQAVLPRPVREAQLRAGRGAQLSDTGEAIVATIVGNPHLEGSVVLVRQEYRIHGNVGLATGHIEFEGDLVIRGDVELQTRIRATGDVMVHGHVEGAEITAGGSIRIKGGVRRGSSLVAGNDLLARFIEGSRVRCGGSLGLSEDLVHSTAEVGAAAIVGGTVAGGLLRVAERIEARVLGARLGTPTEIATLPPERSEEAAAIAQERAAIRANLARIAPKIREAQEAIGRDDRQAPDLEVFRQVLELAAGLTEREAALAEQEQALSISPRHRPSAHVREAIHPGVRLRLGHAHLVVSEAYPPGILIEEAGAVRLLSPI